MDRRTFVAIAGAALLPLPADVRAQAKEPVRRVGFLSGFARRDVDAFRAPLQAELEKLGWVHGRNLALLEFKTSEGRNERLPMLAAELVADAPDVILVQSAPAARAAMGATKSIPIVMIGVGNPLEYGIVTNLARPDGNVTGASYLADESILKLLQLLKETVPRLRSLALFSNPTNEAAAPMVKKLRADAALHRLRLQVLDVTQAGDFEAAFAAIRGERTESMLLPPEPLIRGQRVAIGAFAKTHGLVLGVVGSSVYLPEGGLISYGPTLAQYAELGARYVDRLLKGARPGDLPVEQPARFELAINLKTAQALGLSIPDSMLQRADVVIR